MLKSILTGALACAVPWKKARAAAPSDLPASWAEYPVRVDATKLSRCHPPHSGGKRAGTHRICYLYDGKAYWVDSPTDHRAFLWRAS